MESDDRSLLRLVDRYNRNIYICSHAITLCMLAIFFTCTRTIDAPQKLSGSNLEAHLHSPVRTEHPYFVEAEDGTSLLVDKDRTLWMAGWNARFFQYYSDMPPIISWSTEAEDFVEKEYRRLHFPKDCGAVAGTIRAPGPHHFLFMRMDLKKGSNPLSFPKPICRLHGDSRIRVGGHVRNTGLPVRYPPRHGDQLHPRPRGTLQAVSESP